jgi:hypothetical protein
MAGDIITLPLRLTARAASLALRGTEQIAGRVFGLAMQVAGMTRPRGDASDFHFDPDAHDRPSGGAGTATADSPEPGTAEGFVDSETSADSRDSEAPANADTPGPPMNADTPGPPIEAENVIDLDAPPEQEPVHVSEEPVLAAEFAEPGAEEGAGAQIHVEEPWPGYRDMSAKDVIARVDSLNSAELAAVELFESTNQKRQTVLSAAERQLKLVDHESASHHERSNSNA